MKDTQFGEGQYGSAVARELEARLAPFEPTTNLEYYLAIDAAHSPRALAAICRILSVQIPRGIRLSPLLWPSLPRRFYDEIPGRTVSLFLQYKCPVYQDAKSASKFKWIGGPYFEVEFRKRQQRELRKLERRVRSRAVVRYAAPAFWTRADLDNHDAARAVCQNSGFVRPSKVRSHTKWMYAGPGSIAYFNPEKEIGSMESIDGLFAVLQKKSTVSTLRSHLRELSGSLEEWAPERGAKSHEWVSRLQSYGRFDDRSVELLLDLSLIARVSDRLGASWALLYVPEGPRLEGGPGWAPRWWIFPELW
jgi:hypothetical protein